ncbi:MAG: extensin family protein [Alphaproteobacteria bacterium]
MSRPHRASVFAMLAAVLAGCGGAATPSPPPAARLSGGQCLAALAGRGVDFEKIDDFGSGGGCGVAAAVELRQSTAGLNQMATLDCRLALTLNDYERRVVQPASQRFFGQQVARIHHFGAYACRGRSGAGGRLSEHAKGRAIDIAGFELADGTVVWVEHHWRGGGDRSRFLRTVSRGACDLFQVVLSPNHDADHHDHLHLDIGPWRLCDP